MKTPIIAAVLLVLTTAAPAVAMPQAKWSLILDTWYCSTRGCGIGGPSEADHFVEKETFATRKQCLAEGRRLAKLHGRLIDMHDLGVTIAGIVPRCKRA